MRYIRPRKRTAELGDALLLGNKSLPKRKQIATKDDPKGCRIMVAYSTAACAQADSKSDGMQTCQSHHSEKTPGRGDFMEFRLLRSAAPSGILSDRKKEDGPVRILRSGEKRGASEIELARPTRAHEESQRPKNSPVLPVSSTAPDRMLRRLAATEEFLGRKHS